MWEAGFAGASNQFEDQRGDGYEGYEHQSKQKGFALLLEAYDFAHDVGRPLWDFAVEVHVLRRFGLSEIDFRWLVCNRFVKHAQEVTRADELAVTQSGELGRKFQPCVELVFGDSACFVLTAAGVDFLRSQQHQQVSPTVLSVFDSAHPIGEPNENGSESEIAVPFWDADRRELRFRGALIKQYRTPSPNQEQILMAFEEEHWPTRINDPLPPNPMIVPKSRLRETIRALNRNQKEHLVRFTGDGTGEGVLWAAV